MPRFTDPTDLWAHVAAAPVARLATLRPDGTPRLVPITFALVEGLVCSAVDEVKPKSDQRLARLDDVTRDPRAAVLVDHYVEDWTALWWVRLDAAASIHTDGPLREAALDALATKIEVLAATGSVAIGHSRPAGSTGMCLRLRGEAVTDAAVGKRDLVSVMK